MVKQPGVKLGLTFDGNRKVIRSILIATLLLVSFVVRSQILVYPDDRRVFTDMLLNVKDGALIMGNSTFTTDAVVTIRDNRIYRGWSTSTFDLLYTIRDGKVYPVDSNFSGDILYTIEDGKVYRGNSNFDLDLRYTLRRDSVYKEQSISTFDRVCFIQGRFSEAEYFAILLALELLE